MPSPLNIPKPGINQYHNSRNTGSATMQEWETTHNVQMSAVHTGCCELFSRYPTLAQDVCSREACQCQVYCNRLRCDLLCNNITRFEQARPSRGCVRFASTLAHMCRSFDSSNPPYPYPLTRIVTRRHCATCQVNSSRSAVPMPSIDLNLWNRSRPSAFVPILLGFTPVLTDDIVRSFRKTKS